MITGNLHSTALVSTIVDMRRCVALGLLAAVVCAQPSRKSSAAKPKPASAPAPPQPEAPKVFPIESITVTGSRLYRQEVLVAVTGLKPGEPAEEKSFESARDRLIATGAFTNAGFRYQPGPSGQGYAVTIEVVDFEQLLPYRFDRLDAPDAKLRALLKEKEPLFGDKIPSTTQVVDRFRAHLESALNTKIQGKVSSDRGDDLYVLFSPAGRLPAVAEVYFTGNVVVPTSLLQNTIHGVAIGLEYREDRFRELLDTSIRPVYESRGRLNAAFPKLATEPSKDVKGLRVTVTVDEGNVYSIAGVKVEGVPGGEDAMVQAAALKEGDIASIVTFREAEKRILAALHRLGYMKAVSGIQRTLADQSRTCDITFAVVPGSQFHFGRLFTKGLDLHGESEIKRIWSMKEGQLFNAEYPDYFLNRLQEDGLFDNLRNARAVIFPQESNLSVDVTLVFNERLPTDPKPETEQERKRRPGGRQP